MPFPNSKSLEMPILQELAAIGGADDLRYLYVRLIDYFPQLNDLEISEIKQNKSTKWRKLVQRVGKELDQNGYLNRNRGHWKVTEKGEELVESETIGFELSITTEKKLSHTDIQKMLLTIGDILGFFTEMEFEYYDVVWREVPRASRLSHVFEVQSKGNIDSAFAKLKRAYEAQRSKIFLVIANENDLRRAKKSLENEFQDIENDLTILTFAEVDKTYQNITSISKILTKFLES